MPTIIKAPIEIEIPIKIIIKKSIRISLLFLLFAVPTACKKFVEIDSPTTSLVTTSVFEKNSTATAAQVAIYAQMQTYPQYLNQTTGVSSDEFKNYSSNLTTVNLYTNSLNAASDADKINIWKPAFNFIYQANAILEALPNSPNVTVSVKNQLIGESKFVRAYWLFYLVNLYGDIPLILSTDYKVNTNLSNTPSSQIYQQIITDLTDAQELLNSNYVDATDTVSTAERVRPNKWAAAALLARAYLYTGDWKKAEDASTLVINNTSLYKLPSLDSSFLKNNMEAIWQLQTNSNNKFTTEGSDFIITTNPLTKGGTYVSTISDQLMNAFEAGDNRRTKWVGSYTSTTAPITTYYFPYKYKDNTTATTLREYSMVLRLAEQYLIRAEARAQQNNITGAITDINMLRLRARATPTVAVPNPLPDLLTNLTQSQTLTAIAHERQVELFAEAHRWLDLKRTNTVDAVMTVITPKKGPAKWNSYQQLYPISITDIQNSAYKITQNNGY